MKFINKFQDYYKTAYSTDHFPSVFELLSSKNKVLAYYGFLGDKNFGDELVFESAKMLFHPYKLVPIRKRMPLAHLIYIKFFNMNITGLVVGGGTLIGSKFWDYELFEEIVKTGKPVYIHGTGVHKMNFYHELWKKMLGSNFFGGVRGPVSKDNLNCININTNPVGDAAFAMFKSDNWPAYNKNGKNVLINLGAHGGYPGEENSRTELKKYIEFVINSGFSIQFLPLHTIDVKLGMELKAIYPEITLLEIPKSYNEGIKYFYSCTFAIGERLHFNVMAVLAGCPFLSINYGPKHEDFLASLNLAPHGLKPEELTVDKLIVAFQNRDIFNWDITLKKIKHFKKMQFDEQAKFISNLS